MGRGRETSKGTLGVAKGGLDQGREGGGDLSPPSNSSKVHAECSICQVAFADTPCRLAGLHEPRGWGGVRVLAASGQLSAHHQLTLASTCAAMPPRCSICSPSALGLPTIFCLFFENKFIVFIIKATERHYRESKSDKQRQKPDQLRPPLPALPLGVVPCSLLFLTQVFIFASS